MDQTVAIEPHVTQIEMSDRPPLAETLRRAFQDALAGRGEMDERVYAVGGFCGRKHRLFLNNLVRAIDDPRYLEIGIFHGATLCAAISNNKVHVTGVDNWTEYNGQPNEFYANLLATRGAGAKVSVLEQDFRTIDYAHVGKFNVFFYDGPHDEKDQYDGVAMALPALDNQSVLIVDDWNWDRVRRATMAALRDAGVRLDLALEVRTSLDNTIPPFANAESDWHNGLFAAAISK